ncbi:MAG: hypothetical protein GY862_04210 [Gammaproteobacteria bacterium]|nr:hypothetical protein [Gammaproteobacteria bacterium]
MNRISKSLLIGISLVLAVFLPCGGWGAYIDILNGPPSAFVLTRDGRKIKAPHYTLLQAGDEIRVRKPKNNLYEDKENYLILALENGAFVTLKYTDTQNAPYRVKGGAASPIAAGGFMKSVTAWFGKLHRHEIRLLSLGHRGGRRSAARLSMPLLKGDKARLLPGERVLHLAWSGGEPPYRMQIYREGEGTAWQSKQNIHETKLALEKHLYASGRYQAVLSDSRDNKAEGTFTVSVESGPALAGPETLLVRQSDLPERNKRILLAVWLAAQGKGEWAFEAYQQVADLTAHYHPALLLRYGLEAGSRPKKFAFGKQGGKK